MNQQAKSAIKSLVLDLRHKLEDDIDIQLKRYGFAGERWRPLEQLPHIEQDDQEASAHLRLRTALKQHLRRIGADPDDASARQRAEAVDWFVREVAFTHLNRLVALKCLEVRDLIPEIITTRKAYGGRSRAHRDYRHAHPDEARRPDDALPAAIRHVCRQVHTEFKFLFDVGDPATGRKPPANTILWPDPLVLKECIARINDLDQEAENDDRTLWAEDEIIGWLYQFYNVEEKEAIRDRGRPRRPAEVAVINQFFTPRWIVKFLVDNTLGRLWLEMHPDSERVRKKCDYLVPEPLPAEEVEPKKDGERTFHPDPDSPINSPHARPRRDPKPPQELRLLDPACGTMHFGHYAFEVFQAIYEDAIDRGWAEPPEESIAAAILRHNLYGVDIDLRAVQLAGLSLFIKAKSADPNAHVSHLNLVVADAVLPEDGARERFLAQYDDDGVVQDAVRQVLEEMENVAQVGSLLRVEERLRDILAEAGHASAKSWDGDGQPDLPGFQAQRRQLSLAETAGAGAEAWGAQYTVARLTEDLRQFTNRALQTHDLNAQLFAQEAEKTVHLLDVFLNEHAVVVMNPPYGYTIPRVRSDLRKVYPDNFRDLYAAFVERSLDLVQENGLIGALTSKTFMTLTSFAPLRKDHILTKSSIEALLDLGIGILDDATVETAAYVMRKRSPQDEVTGLYIRLSDVSHKQESFSRTLNSSPISKESSTYIVQQSSFKDMPGAPICYYMVPSVRQLFATYPPLDSETYFKYLADSRPHPKISFAEVKQGLIPGSYDRFVRLRWEVSLNDSSLKNWVTYCKGGDFSRYYYDNEYVVDWTEDGKAMKQYAADHYGSASRTIKNEKYFFKKGLTLPAISSLGLNVRQMPPGCIFSDKGLAVFSSKDVESGLILGVLNSFLGDYVLHNLHPGRQFNVTHLASVPFKNFGSEAEVMVIAANECHDLKAAWDTGNEICTRFEAPWLVQVGEETGGIEKVGAQLGDDAPDIALPEPVTLEALLDAVRAIERAADARLQALQAQIDETVYDLYGISERDRRLIERELGDRPPELVWPQMEGKSDEEKRREHVRRLLSYFLLQALKERRDGILPLGDGAGQGTALEAVRRRMAGTFGEETAFRMESEIKDVLDRDIADWLDGPFIKWHTKLYKKCPVIWQLSSDDYHNTFNCFVYYHALDADTLRKVQTQYLWPQRRATQSALESARQDQREDVSGASSRVKDAEEDLEVLETFEERLLSVIEGEAPYEPPAWAEGPIRDGVYDPVLDDGVKVNIMPLQKARILRYKRLV